MIPVGADRVAAYRRDGYLVVESFLSSEELTLLRSESDAAVQSLEADMRARGDTEDGLSRIGQRYYVGGTSRYSADLRRFLQGPKMVEVCRSLVGPSAYLFTDVFVCKEPGQRLNACWHQDFSYLDYFYPGKFAPNLSAWLALDDMTEQNGALQVKAFSRGGPSEPVPHRLELDWDSPDVVDFGDSPTDVLPVAAGTLVVMNGLLAHWSAANGTDRRRRAYLVQYSPKPVLVDDEPIQLAVPIVEDGRAHAP